MPSTESKQQALARLLVSKKGTLDDQCALELMVNAGFLSEKRARAVVRAWAARRT
jgi:hypothetical protein